MYRSQFPQKSFEHLGHLYRPVGLTPSGTGSLASGVISVSHPKQSGERVDCCRLSTVTTPYFVTGNNSQKLIRQRSFFCLIMGMETGLTFWRDGDY